MQILKINLKLTVLVTLLLSTCLVVLTACGPLGDLVYQGKTTELGPFQVDGTITGSIVGTQIALSDDGQTLVSEDYRRRTIYRKFGGNWPQVYMLDYRSSSGVADEKGTPWFSPKLDETGTTLLTSDKDKLSIFEPQTANGQGWQGERFLSAALDVESYRYSRALLSSNAEIAVLSHKTTNDGSFSILNKDITIWEQQSGTWTQIASIDRLADSGAGTDYNALNFSLGLLDINRDGSRILVAGPNGAFVHNRNGNSWQSKAQLVPTTSIFSFNEKGVLNGSGNRVALEAGTNTNGPKVILFDFINNAWRESFDFDGELMAMSSNGQTLVLQNFVQTGADFIGTPQSQGFLEVYTQSGGSSGSWQKVATFAPGSDRNRYQRVELSADGAVLAATLQDPPFSSSVRLEIYTR